MALIICEECGKEYSDKAPACPNCGCPTPEPRNSEVVNEPFELSSGNNSDEEPSNPFRVVAIIILVVFGAFILTLLWPYIKKDEKPKETTDSYSYLEDDTDSDDNDSYSDDSYSDDSYSDYDDDEYYEDDEEEYITTLEDVYGTIYEEDMYKVGEDIPAGEYILFSTDDDGDGYFKISSDSSDDLDSIILNDLFHTNSVIEIKKGEYLELKKCYAVKSTKKIKLDSSNDGMFRIGIDVNPGEYKLIATDDSAYYSIDSDARHSIVSNKNFTKSVYVTLRKGQYLKLHNCYIKK